MGLPFVLVLVVGVLVFLGLVAWGLVGRSRARPRTAAERQTTRRSPVPEPGDPSPRVHGRPVPGSRADRHQHGKP
jgi:hypothetical protein